MKIIVSEKLKANEFDFLELLVARSKEKWKEGTRTSAKYVPLSYGFFSVRTNGKPFLVSSYIAGGIVTITTAQWMYVMLTDELPEEVRAEIVAAHVEVLGVFAAKFPNEKGK